LSNLVEKGTHTTKGHSERPLSERVRTLRWIIVVGIWLVVIGYQALKEFLLDFGLGERLAFG
jgi:hypothetical protein